MRTHPIEVLAKAIENKQPAVLATVIEGKGASPAKVGAQILLLEDERTAGTVGGGKLESAILDDARHTLRRPNMKKLLVWLHCDFILDC